MLHRLSRICSRFRSWPITAVGHAALVEMDSNPVNCMNPSFFDDFHDTFDLLESDYPDSPVILSSAGDRAWSSGLDLRYVATLSDLVKKSYPLCRSPNRFVYEMNRAMCRLHGFPRPTVAFLNDHCLAGGFSFALCCDLRFMALPDDDAPMYKIGMHAPRLNLTYPWMTHFVLGSKLPAPVGDIILALGKSYDSLDEAVFDRFLYSYGSEEDMMDLALELTSNIGIDTHERIKRRFAEDAKEFYYERNGESLDSDFVRLLCSEETKQAIIELLDL